MPQIQLKRVSKYYVQDGKRTAAVEEVNLTIEQGEFVFITGSSGAGKSTLLNLICGELRPDRGAIYLDGLNVSGPFRRNWERYRRLFGYVPQATQLMRQRTIKENLESIAMLDRGRGQGTVAQRIEKALGMVGLPGVEGRYPVELSQGECRRVELARAIITSPPILVLDELTANLDEDTIWDIFHLLEDLNYRGTTILMATHAKPFVNMLRKRVVTVVDGQIYADVEKGRYGDVVSRRP
ncbi:MAG: cell division ATP-binding protein FtsE [Lawsonibacter sp.]|jgi:cell division transport system ATP-binding protein